jgi:hypothetical protein
LKKSPKKWALALEETKVCKKGLHQYAKYLKRCPICRQASRAACSIFSKDKIATSKLKYNLLNKEKILKDKKDNYFLNKSSIILNKKFYHRKKRIIDPLFKLKENIRSLIINTLKLKGFKKTSKTFQLLGCTFEEVQAHLINTAIKRYNLYDPNFKYHIDHIIPCASAKTEEELIKLQYYTNLQYLTPEDNLRKGNKI